MRHWKLCLCALLLAMIATLYYNLTEAQKTLIELEQEASSTIELLMNARDDDRHEINYLQQVIEDLLRHGPIQLNLDEQKGAD